MKKNLLITGLMLATGLLAQAQNRSIFLVHTATAENTTSNWTLIDHPWLNGNPDAILEVSQNWNPMGIGGTSNDRTVAVWYYADVQQWAVYNEDESDMTIGASFNLMIAGDDAAAAYTHLAAKGNLNGNSTYLDDAAINGDGTASVFASHNYGPFYIYNPHTTGVWFDGYVWAVYQEDGSNYPDGAASNILVPGTNMHSYQFTTTAGNISGTYAYIDDPELNNHPEAAIILEHNSGTGGLYNDHDMGVWYDSTPMQWVLYTQDNTNMIEGLVFNIVYGYPQPSNDECVNSISINNLFHQGLSTQTSTTQTNNGATSLTDADISSDCWVDSDIINTSVWYSFIGDGLNYTITSTDCGGILGDTYIDNADAQFAIYTGGCGALTMVACNDDGQGAGAGNWYAELNLTTEDGVVYYLLVDGYSTSGFPPADGNFCIQVAQQLVGVDEETNVSVQLYPNPAADVLSITSPSPLGNITCFNSLGEQVMAKTNVSETNLQFDIASLAAGMYYITVQSGDALDVLNFIKE